MWTENILLNAFFRVIPRNLNFICQSFGTLRLFLLHRRVGMKNFFILTRLWRWNRVFRNVGIQNSDAEELPRRKRTAFRTRRKFEIKKISCPAVNPHSIPSGWFRYVRMPDNVTFQVRRHPSSREPVTTVNKKDERRKASISVHSCRLDLRNVAVWRFVSLLLISEVRKHLSRFEVSRGFPLSLQTNVS